MKHVAICVGHSRPNDKGATSVNGTSEWDYNEVVSELTGRILRSAGIKVSIFDLYQGDSYGTAMQWLSQRLNELIPVADCAIELHFNSADSRGAEGFEYIHWHTSSEGKRLAECMLQTQAQMSPTQKNRGRKEANYDSRGGSFLVKPSCPCVLTEPFFGSSDKEWAMFGTEQGQELLAIIYARALTSFLDLSFPLPYVDSAPATNVPAPFSSEIADGIDRIEHEIREIRRLL